MYGEENKSIINSINNITKFWAIKIEAKDKVSSMDKVSMNFFSGLILLCDFIQGGRGHWAVYYTSPQSFIITLLISWLNNFGEFIDFWLVGSIS